MKAILAADENYAIGRNGALLAYIKEDLKYFKENTINKTVVFGRKTLYTFPNQKPLPNRNNIILSRDKNLKVENATVVSSIEETLQIIKDISSDDVFIIGGAQIYNLFLPYVDEIFLTKLHVKFDEADAFFPNLDNRSDFKLTWQSERYKSNDIEFTFMRYQRIK